MASEETVWPLGTWIALRSNAADGANTGATCIPRCVALIQRHPAQDGLSRSAETKLAQAHQFTSPALEDEA